MIRKQVTILLLLFSTASVAQQGKIQLVARAQPDKILLRWAPTSSVVWELANKYGYTIERYTVLKDSVLLDPREFVVMTPPLVKPRPQAEWETQIDTDDYAAVAAQAIFGETFELSQNYDKDIFQIAQKTQERDQRFSFALFAADQSFKAAELSGLGIADFDVDERETYLYRVFANIPVETYQVDTAVVYLSNKNVSPLPQINDVEAEFGDKGVVLSWNKSLTDRFYNSFIVEKSVGGEDSFRSISDKPIINAYSGEEEGVDSYFKLDTLEENNRLYEYRIIGITPFGEKGPPSAVIEGMGKPTVDAVAGISRHEIDAESRAKIYWQYPKAKESLIDGFVLQVAAKQEGPYRRINEESIKKSTRSYMVERPRGTGYYRVGLLLGDQVLNASFPYLVQLEDSIAPVQPRNFSSAITKEGVVSISWDENKEEDLWGYRVYRSNFRKSEFAEITSDPIPSNFLSDTVAVENLTEKVYYKVVAVDLRDNRSGQSEIIEIDKPDLIPPAPPVFKAMESREEGAWMSWHPSSSSDLDGYMVFRGVTGTSSWELVANLPQSVNFFLDTTAIAGKTHIYTIVTFDDAGLESDPIKPIRVGRLLKEVNLEFLRFDGRVEREKKRIVLFWKLEGSELGQIQIYRGIGDQPVSLYKTVRDTDQFVDEQVRQNLRYSYQLKAVLVNGKGGGFSKKLDVKY